MNITNITYESICEKLGFDPMKDSYPYQCKEHEDDSQISPLSILSREEKDFLWEYTKRFR